MVKNIGWCGFCDRLFEKVEWFVDVVYWECMVWSWGWICLVGGRLLRWIVFYLVCVY